MQQVSTESAETAVSIYLRAIDRLWRTGKATEHTYRGALQELLSALLPGFAVLNEPKRIECGAPDYIVMRRGLPVAFVEAKDIGDLDLDGKKKTGNKEQFDRYKAAIGAELRRCHLMQDAPPPLLERIAAFPVAGDNVVEEAWSLYIGGYQSAQKWLKDRKGRALSSDDLRHWQRIVLALVRTAALMRELSMFSKRLFP